MLTSKVQNFSAPSKLTDQWIRHANISPTFLSILERMLRFNSSERYQSANDVLTALSHSQLLPFSDSLPVLTPSKEIRTSHSNLKTSPISDHLEEVSSDFTPSLASIQTTTQFSPRPVHMQPFLLVLLGASSCFLAITLSSFLPKWIAVLFWSLITSTVIFRAFDRNYSKLDKIQLFIIMLTPTGIVLFLFPYFFLSGMLTRSFPQVLFSAILAGFLAFFLANLYQLSLRLFRLLD